MTAAATPETPVDAVAAGGSKKTMLFAIAALVVGGGIGMFVLGPKMHGAAKPAVEAKAAQDAKPEAAKIFRLDNIIVNPAGTQGQRFLIVSIAIEVGTDPTLERLKNSEVPLRDAVTGMIERMTLPQLTQLGARDTVRAGVLVYARKFADDSAVHVYLPQFLIQ
jgi:flagellar protein FliL